MGNIWGEGFSHLFGSIILQSSGLTAFIPWWRGSTVGWGMGAILIHNSSAAFRQDSISGWPYFLRKGGLIPNFAIYIYIHIFVHFCFIDSLLPPPPYLTFFPNFNIYIFLYIFYSQLGVLSPPPSSHVFSKFCYIQSDSFLAAPPLSHDKRYCQIW